MAFTDPTHVITCTGTIIWEAVTNPDPIDNKPGAVSHNLRIAVPANAPEIAELQKLVDDCLASPKASEKNIGPTNKGNNPISPIDESKFGKHGLSGQVCFSAGTMQGCPPVFDANGAQLQAMAYGPQLYNGAKVKLLVHAYPYNNKQKGVNFGLDGVQIIDGTAPKILIGEGGMAVDKVAAAFGGAASAPAPALPVAAPPAVPVAGAAFPPAGWLAHPTAAGYFYCGTEVLTEADLRANFAAPASAPVAAPPAVPVAPHTEYMEPPAPPAVFPPAGWLPHPSSPGYFYCGTEVLTEAQLRARP